MFRNFKFLLIALVILFLASSSYAFAASNTVPATRAGDGTGNVSGYTITSVAYNLKIGDPTTLESVQFDIGAAATDGKVKVKLVASGTTWYDCVHGTGYVWTCDTSDLPLADIDQLRVVAAQ